MTRYIAIDLGNKRTGLAAGDSITRIVQPLEVLEAPRGPQLLTQLLRAIDRQGADALVIGLPVNMDGTEGAAAVDARTFGAQIGERARLPVHFQDERLTSFDADQRMARSGLTHKGKRQLRDALAACVILEGWLQRDQE